MGCDAGPVKCAWNVRASAFAPDLRCSCRLGCWLFTDVSAHPVGPVFQGQAIQSEEHEVTSDSVRSKPVQLFVRRLFRYLYFFKIFFFSRPSRQTLEPTKPHSCYLGTGGEVDHPLPSTAEVKNEWSYASTPYMLSYYFTSAFFYLHQSNWRSCATTVPVWTRTQVVLAGGSEAHPSH